MAAPLDLVNYLVNDFVVVCRQGSIERSLDLLVRQSGEGILKSHGNLRRYPPFERNHRRL